MTRLRKNILVAVVLSLSAASALASWYDDYDAGITAAKKGQWQTVIQKMSGAIAGNARENNNARTYGAIFINYHPYYYRGVAYLNTGKLEQAIADFEKTQGPGEADLGSLDVLMQRAKSKLEAASAAPEPPPAATAPQPARQAAPPAAPAIDPALRQRVAASITTANTSLASARGRNASGSALYGQAMNALAEANTKMTTAKNNDDLNVALAAAENATLFANSAVAPGASPKAPVQVAQPVTPRPAVATDLALSDYRAALRAALTSYFAGEFDSASRSFEQLSRAMPNNGWVWAFLGASRYSQYAFEADESYKQAAVAAFKRAKRSSHFRRGLPEKYFSKRVRKFFDSVG